MLFVKAALRILDTGVMEVLEGIGSRDYLGVEDAFEATQNLMNAPNPQALMDATALLWCDKYMIHASLYV
jgi:hypothetical protein